MTQLVVNFRDEQRLPFVVELLQAFDFIESVAVQPSKRLQQELDVPREALHQMSEAALMRVWDNEQDAVYDNWRELYGVPEG